MGFERQAIGVGLIGLWLALIRAAEWGLGDVKWDALSPFFVGGGVIGRGSGRSGVDTGIGAPRG